MSEKPSSSSKIIFDGSQLSMKDDTIVVNPKGNEESNSLPETLTKSAGGKVYKSLSDAFADVKNSLKVVARVR